MSRRDARHRLVIAIALGACVAAGQDQAQEPLALCIVAANVSAYAGKTVRLRALYVTGPEGSALYDPGCQQGQPLVWVDFNPSVSGKWGSLKRILHRSNRAAVTIEGTMRGGEPTKIDPKLPEQIKEALKNQKERYGHLGGFDMAIEVSRIIEAKPVK